MVLEGKRSVCFVLKETKGTQTSEKTSQELWKTLLPRLIMVATIQDYKRASIFTNYNKKVKKPSLSLNQQLEKRMSLFSQIL